MHHRPRSLFKDSISERISKRQSVWLARNQTVALRNLACPRCRCSRDGIVHVVLQIISKPAVDKGVSFDIFGDYRAVLRLTVKAHNLVRNHIVAHISTVHTGRSVPRQFYPLRCFSGSQRSNLQRRVDTDIYVLFSLLPFSLSVESHYTICVVALSHAAVEI